MSLQRQLAAEQRAAIAGRRAIERNRDAWEALVGQVDPEDRPAPVTTGAGSESR